MRSLFIAALLNCAGCHLIYPFDAERTPDAALDAALDAGADGDLAAADLQVDAPSDAAPDAGPDAAPDAAPEVGVKTLAGTGVAGYKDGPADKAQFFEPAGIAVDSKGVVYVTEEYNHTVRKIEKGVVSTVAGDGTAGADNGPALTARLDTPSGVAIDAKGVLVIADFGNQQIRLISGGSVSTLAGTGATGNKDGPLLQATFSGPHEVALHGAAIYVVEYNGHRVRKIEGASVSTVAGDGVYGYKDGPGPGARFASPAGVDVDTAGTVFVADNGNSSIRTIFGGSVATVAGSQKSGYLDGPALSALFDSPSDVALGPGGRLYISDFDDSRIRALQGGKVTTVAGDGVGGHKDGAPLQARLNRPHSLAVGPDGRIYVTDFKGHRVRVIQP